MNILVILLIAAGIVLFLTRKKQEKETIQVRPYTKMVTVKGHSRSKSKDKKKKRRSSKR